ncbi:cytochrome P450 [Kitasatospora aureofaciens]|uniref:cytochrome P450 n=1 Tax=Kitasatospora aureofaciens TaxID=1894 RepID=UPI001C46D9E9|nr:cytochrome P450 [Kitasatospora aureofaciens]MBV6696126.1 cytochrome P450 [Kitasatospora aureofaciens]
MDGTAIIEQLLTSEGRADPYPLYARAHELGTAASAGPDTLLALGHGTADKVLRTAGFGVATAEMQSGPAPEFVEHSSLALFGGSILERNAPDHARVRSLIASVFTARRVAALRPAVEAAVATLLDEMAEAGSDGSAVDFMDAFAFRLPVGVICELLGVPEQDRYRFRALAGDLTVALEFVQDLAELGAADAAADELSGYFTELAARRLAHPQDDLVTDLARIAADDPERLSGRELLANLVLLLVAGFETTTNLLGNGLALLFRHPDVTAALRTGTLDPAGFTEEVLRYDSPVQLTTRIALTEGVAVDDLPAPPGSMVLVLLGAANHDPARYHRPEVFDPNRTGSQPLSFGAGQHYCLGSQLARLEAEVAVPALLGRFPRLAPAGVPIRRDRLVLRGYETLPVVVR